MSHITEPVSRGTSRWSSSYGIQWVSLTHYFWL